MWTLQNNIIWTFNRMSISSYRAVVLNPGPPGFKMSASFRNLTFLLWKYKPEDGCGSKEYSKKQEPNNKWKFLPSRLYFVHVYTYPNPKPTPYNNARIVHIVVQCEKNDAILICACPVVLLHAF